MDCGARKEGEIAMNHVILIGRLTRDPEVRYSKNGHAVGNFTLAVDRNYTNQAGERETDFIPVVTWRKLAENCANHLNKGRLVAVVGRLEIKTYDGDDGQKRRSAQVVASEVKFLDYGKKGEKSADKASDDMDFGEIDLDQLPF